MRSLAWVMMRISTRHWRREAALRLPLQLDCAPLPLLQLLLGGFIKLYPSTAVEAVEATSEGDEMDEDSSPAGDEALDGAVLDAEREKGEGGKAAKGGGRKRKQPTKASKRARSKTEQSMETLPTASSGLENGAENGAESSESVLDSDEMEVDNDELMESSLSKEAFVRADSDAPPLDELPMAYAKVVGVDFQAFVVRPRIVLGRADESWQRAMSVVGMPLIRGVAVGDVDIHLGNHRSIANHHAVVEWDGANKGRFVITAKATPLVVDGVELAHGQSAPLKSKSVIRAGTKR